MGNVLQRHSGANDTSSDHVAHATELEHLDSIAYGVDTAEDEFAFEPPIKKRLGGAVVETSGVMRYFEAAAGSDADEPVMALRELTLARTSELYPIRAGEFVIVRGPSGGGKTTLLNILGALDRPSRGSLTLLGQPISNKTTDKQLASMRLSQIGFVFQTFNLLSAFSALENVELPMLMLNVLDAKARRTRALDLLASVGLADRAHHLPSEMSGGEQQRVAIARALANEPQLMLLDEPTGSLDSHATVEIMNILYRINIERKTTFVMVTHNPDLECYADRILYVIDGVIVSQVLNEEQVQLTHETYQRLLNEVERSTNVTALTREHHIK
ncbi:ABC transporter H family member 2 [Porphyridium purpureum]|uniref:Probable ATP-dependent transporter ycf16 n=1 Tax=Porphyridium purpureum TaxID=35688 RepID=A0A5J4YKA8_PORPP|nr:ABC transporter H family member 2 [Porphyridium purpureum]|eukprot:POR8378..scf244_11